MNTRLKKILKLCQKGHDHILKYRTSIIRDAFERLDSGESRESILSNIYVPAKGHTITIHINSKKTEEKEEE